MREVVALEGLSRTDWLKARRQGIGGSDVAAILGLDHFRGPLDVYVDKVTGEEQAENSMMRLGRYMEDGIAQAYAEQTGSEVTMPTHLYGHDTHEWALANPDRFTDNSGLGVLEIKLSSRADIWDEGLPEAHELQCLWYLGVTGLPYADLAVLLGGRELRLFRVERDDATISNLFKITGDFWARVENRDPPPPDARSADSLKRLYKGGADTVELSAETAETINLLRAAQAEEKAATASVDLLKNMLRAELGDYEVGTLGGVPVCSWSRAIRSGVDMDGLEMKHPDIVAAFRTGKPYRTLRLKRAKP